MTFNCIDGQSCAFITVTTNGRIALNGSTSGGPFGRVIFMKNATLNMDAEEHEFAGGGYYNCAIYADSPASFIFDACTVDIRNYVSTGAAIRWNGKDNDRGYSVEMINGTEFVSDSNYAGFIGTLDMLIDASTVKVVNSRGYGSNGTYHTITNDSYVLFDNNTDWGISAYTIDMSENSELIATNNGRSGVWVRILNVDETCTLDVENNGFDFFFAGGTGTSAASNAGITFWGNGSTPGVIEEGANVTITGNAGSGIATLQTVANLTIGSASITNNGSGDGSGNNPAVYDGGIYNVGTVVLGDSVVLYNNHATDAGDDIYSTGTVTFGATGSKWFLDGDPDCQHAIDGWYDDSEGSRWNAEIGGVSCSTDNPDEHYVDKFDVNGTATASGVALKAAHGEETVELELKGAKVLDGRAMEENEFSFVLKDSNDAEIQEVSNDADGAFAFDAISYDITAVGETYTYTVSELLPEDDDSNAAGVQSGYVTYDEEPVTVTVTVEVIDGDLVPAVSYEKAGVEAESISFTNVYAEPSVEDPEEPTTPEEPMTTPDDGGDDVTTPADTTDTTDMTDTTGSDLLQTGDPVSVVAVAMAAVAGVAAIGAGTLLGKRRK